MITDRQFELRRASNILLLGLLFLIIAGTVVAGTNRAIRESLAAERDATVKSFQTTSRDLDQDVWVAQQTEDLVVRMANVYDSLVLGLLACAFLCGVFGVTILVKGATQRIRPDSITAMYSSLGDIIDGMEVAAFRVAHEAQQKEADADALRLRVEEFKALASLTEPQVRALTRRLSRGTSVGIVLGVMGIAVTVGIAMWQLGQQ